MVAGFALGRNGFGRVQGHFAPETMKDAAFRRKAKGRQPGAEVGSDDQPGR